MLQEFVAVQGLRHTRSSFFSPLPHTMNKLLGRIIASPCDRPNNGQDWEKERAL